MLKNFMTLNPTIPETRTDPFRVVSTVELLNGPTEPEWLVEDVLPLGQPLVIGGPAKSYKTSIMVDMCYSLATGTAFLGQFRVPQPRRVLVMSGESGSTALANLVLRLDDARNGAHELYGNLFWSERLPALDNPRDRAALQAELRARGAEVVVIDPLYMSLLSGNYSDAMNLYAVGSILTRFAADCREIGVTVVLVHHTGKTASSSRGTSLPHLRDLSQAGIAEFVRAWLLLAPSKSSPNSSRTELNMVIGGSAGHRSHWLLEIDEGSPGKRIWKVQLKLGTSPAEY